MGCCARKASTQRYRSASAPNSARPFRNSTFSEYYTNQRQPHGSNCSQLQRPQAPNLENSNRKGAEWAPSKVPGKQPKNSQPNSRKTTVLDGSGVFPAVLGLFPRRFPQDPIGTLFGFFPAVFKVLRSGLCSWSEHSAITIA